MKKILLLTMILSIASAKMIAQDVNYKKTTDNERIIKIDFNKSAGELNTMFKECIGAGRANEGLRADWQQQLALLKKDAVSGISACMVY